MCMYVDVASARTEEDQASGSNTNGIVAAPPERCFYEAQSECPSIENGGCPCKRILPSHNNSDANAILCCNLDAKNFETSLACASKYTTMFNFFLYQNVNCRIIKFMADVLELENFSICEIAECVEL